MVGNIAASIQNNSQLSDRVKKATDNLLSAMKNGDGFAKDIAKLESNVIQNGFSNSDSYQKRPKGCRNMPAVTNKESNAFSKTGGFSTLTQ